MKTEPELKFDTQNNAAISLHIMAEYARRCELEVISVRPGSAGLILEYRFVGLRPRS